MKKQLSLLAICLCGFGIANAQTTTNTNSSSSTNSTYSTSPVTTDSTNAANTANTTTMSNSNNAGMSNGTMNNGSSNNNNSTYSTNGTGAATNGTTTTYSTTQPTDVNKTKDYKNFVFGLYAGLNSTRLKGEDLNSDDIRGRVGYQAGFFVRGGGRLYGQLGAEYFASSSNYYSVGSGTSAATIRDNINIQYVQIPVYIGYKLFQSDRGISAVRLQVGLEYANRISSNSGDFNLSNSEIKSGTFNGLGQLGFDIGPLLIDLTYHSGFSDAIGGTGFAGSQRRILSASVGFKF